MAIIYIHIISTLAFFYMASFISFQHRQWHPYFVDEKT